MGKKAFIDAAAPKADPKPEMAKPATQRFRSRSAVIRLAPDAATRQGRVATLAWEAFGDRDAMIAFLNTHDMALGGRPIDLAVESDAGLAAVAAQLATLSAPR